MKCTEAVGTALLGINCSIACQERQSPLGRERRQDVWNNLKLAVDMDLSTERLRERKKAASLHMRWLEEDDVNPGGLRKKKCTFL